MRRLPVWWLPVRLERLWWLWWLWGLRRLLRVLGTLPLVLGPREARRPFLDQGGGKRR